MIYHIYDKTKLQNPPQNDQNNTWVDFRDFYTNNNILNSDIIVKELVNSDDFLRMILANLNPKKSFLSHCFYLERPQNASPELSSFIVTDAALNQFPDLTTRVKITKNTLDFCIKNKLFNQDKNDKLLVTFLNHSGHFNIKNPTACDSHLLVTECERTMGDLADFSDYQLDCCLSQKSRSVKQINQNRNTNIIVVNDINEGNSIVKSFLLNGWKGYGFLTGLDMTIIMNSRSNLQDNIDAISKIIK